MKRARRSAKESARPSAAAGTAAWDGHPLSPAFLAMLPLFAAYEFSLVAGGGARRNASEVVLGLWLAPFGSHADGVRIALLVAAIPVALYFCRAGGIRVRESVARIWLEAMVAALTLGPALVATTALCLRLLGLESVSWDASRDGPTAAQAALVFGGAVWEELLFRIGLYGLLYWTFVRAARLLGLGADGGRRLADVLALALSALAFAAFHFRRFTHWLWEGGIAFSWPTFLWISGAGVLLGLIYRLRGPGVAAGAHGLFNLGLLIGIDPEVLT